MGRRATGHLAPSFRRSMPSSTVDGMITSIHAMIYSDDAPATRAFLRDVLAWPCVEHPESEPGWLIFGSGASEMGVHPTHSEWEGQTYDHPRQHQISLMCDDIATTRAELEAKGATFSSDIIDEGYGWTTMLDVPGADAIMLYQPNHPTAYDLS
jgi:catechol 2,3-dioxygenase-like lactoylglutathione lyase family enzyme